MLVQKVGVLKEGLLGSSVKPMNTTHEGNIMVKLQIIAFRAVGVFGSSALLNLFYGSTLNGAN
jgi:hypothetical protein